MIFFNKQNNQFEIETENVSYQFRIDAFGQLEHQYWGKKIQGINATSNYPELDRGYSTNYFLTQDRASSYDFKPLELSTYGNGDFRESSLIIRNDRGVYINDFLYDSHTIEANKMMMENLPSSHGTGQTLKVILKDRYLDVFVSLYYHVFDDSDNIVRHIEVKNKSDEIIHIDKIASANVDFIDDEYDLIYLSGAWAQERSDIRRETINRGTLKLDSKRGTTSHQMAPFVALVDPNTNNTQGNAYSFNFMYSSSFEIVIENNEIKQTRIQVGLQSQDLHLSLNKDEKIQTPELVLSFSDKGLNGLMQSHHDFVENHVIPKKYKHNERPILINNWEATYFDFNEEKILEIATSAHELGVELFVLDDGWFGKRNNDNSSLGDWHVNKEKLPNGLKKISDTIKAYGMKFGLWIEPEMISVRSELFKRHPDYMMKSMNRDATPSRDQFVLDFSKEEVVSEIFNQLEDVFTGLDLDYVKWDMNRNITDAFSMIDHRPVNMLDYTKGVYTLAKRLMDRFPGILFEACAGGGGRFDWGMLTLFPQVWTSDNTDAIERLKIQDGSLLIFPQSTMGAHISDVPNHQVMRTTSIDMRFSVSAPYNLGYELDVSKISSEDKEKVITYNQWYKKHRLLLQWGRISRISKLGETNRFAIQTLSEQKDTLIVFIYTVLARVNAPLWIIKLNDLDPGTHYEFNNQIYSSEELMYKGIYVPMEMNADFNSKIMEFNKVSL